MQIGAHIGEGAPSDGRLDEHRENDEAGPRIGQDGGVIGNEAAARFLGVRRGAGARVRHELEDEPRGRERKHCREDEENIAPAEQVAEHAACRLAEQLPGNLPREIATEDRLPPRIRRHVPDVSHGERNDPAGGDAGGEARNGERRERLHRAAQRHQDRGQRAHGRDRAIRVSRSPAPSPGWQSPRLPTGRWSASGLFQKMRGLARRMLLVVIPGPPISGLPEIGI